MNRSQDRRRDDVRLLKGGERSRADENTGMGGSKKKWHIKQKRVSVVAAVALLVHHCWYAREVEFFFELAREVELIEGEIEAFIVISTIARLNLED